MSISNSRDEPTKLAEIVVPLLGPSEAQEVLLENGGMARLLHGALSQDDCASYLLDGQICLVAGSDYVRGTGFILFEMGLLDYYDIGWYLAGANLSDIAAMGAQPLGLLSVVRYPKQMDDESFSMILQGISDCCRAFGALNVGGDIGTATEVILSASAFGIVEPGALLTRGGAKPGDLLCISGPTGYAGSAMKLARARMHDLHSSYGALLSHWKRVAPRIAHARLFAESGVVTACIDTSDGLKAAIETIATRSSVGVSIEGSSIPIPPEVAEASQLLKLDPLELVLGDSVDFELLCCVKEEGLPQLVEECASRELSLIPIGRVTGEAELVINFAHESRSLPGVAWRHV